MPFQFPFRSYTSHGFAPPSSSTHVRTAQQGAHVNNFLCFLHCSSPGLNNPIQTYIYMQRFFFFYYSFYKNRIIFYTISKDALVYTRHFYPPFTFKTDSFIMFGILTTTTITTTPKHINILKKYFLNQINGFYRSVFSLRLIICT